MSQSAGKYVTLTDQNFSHEVLKNPKPVLVDFWAPWCGPCQVMAPVISDLAGEFGARATVAKLNVDDYQDLALRYGIQSVPTLVLFQGGKAVDHIVGVVPKKVLSQRLIHLLEAA